MKKLLWVMLYGLILTGPNPLAGWAQVVPLPKFSFSRRADTHYMDSITRTAKRRYAALNALPRTAANDTLRFRTLYLLGSAYKWWYGRRDSTAYFGNELTDQARQCGNLFFVVNGKLLLEEYYRNGQLNTPKALRLNLDILNAIPPSAYYDVVRCRVNLNLGDLYGLANDFTKALYYLNQARQVVARELTYAGPVTTGIYRTEVEQHFGALYKQTGNFEQSEQHYLNAERLLITNAYDEGSKAFIYDDLAELYLQFRQYDRALPYAKKAEAIWERIKPAGESKGWGSLASIYAGLGQDDLAFRYAQQVLQLSKPSKFISEQAYSALYRVSEHRQDWKSRALYYEKYIAVKDTIARDQRSVELNTIQKEAELERLALQNKQAQLLQAGHLLIIQEQAALDRQQAVAQTDALTKKAELTEQQRLLEQERAQRATNTLLRQRTQQKIEQDAFIRETRQQERVRLLLLMGLTVLFLLTMGLIFLYRRNQRQKHQIQQLNEGLEQTVQARTAELLTVNDDLRRASAAIRETDTRIIQTQENDRQRIAADLHDDLGGTLATLRRRLADIRQQMLDPSAARQLDDLEPMIQKSSDDLRRIAHNLMPPEFSRLGLNAAIEQLVNAQPAQATRFSFIVSGNELKLPVDTELNAYRIVSELVQNINKHARAKRAAVQLLYQPARLLITVEDDGSGNRIDKLPNEQDGIGLKTSKLRAEYIGATLWRDASEAGTLVVLDIPYQRSDAAASPRPNPVD